MLIFNALTGNYENGSGTMETVERLLAEKYGSAFRATHIGNRYNTGSATLFCRTENGQDICFTAVYTPLDRLLTDDYPARIAAHALGRELTEAFQTKGISAVPHILLCGGHYDAVPPVDMTAQRYIEDSGTDLLHIRMAVGASSDMSAIPGVLEEISRKYGNIRIIAAVFVIADEKLEECRSALSEVPRVNDRWFSRFSPAADAGITVTDGRANKTAEQFAAALKG